MTERHAIYHAKREERFLGDVLPAGVKIFRWSHRPGWVKIDYHGRKQSPRLYERLARKFKTVQIVGAQGWAQA
jgi:hypothetical protein